MRSGGVGIGLGGVLGVRGALRRIFCFVGRGAPVLGRFNLGRLGLFGFGLIGSSGRFSVAGISQGVFLIAFSRRDALVRGVLRSFGSLTRRQAARAFCRGVGNDHALLFWRIGEIDSHARKNYDADGDGVTDNRLTSAHAGGPLEDLVWGYADQRGDDFRQLMAVAFPVLCHDRRDGRNRHAVPDLPILIQLESQRGRKAWLRRIVGLAAHNDGHDRPLRAPLLEKPDFLIHMTASGRSGRAEDD